jgi:hypothetical protein
MKCNEFIEELNEINKFNIHSNNGRHNVMVLSEQLAEEGQVIEEVESDFV